ncbi:MAG: hypothetical protein M3004_01645 [Bacteroidota bacterium]|nr:hypothetical protein [Bacteroidota bacterium]
MKLKQLSLKQALNDGYRFIKPVRADIEKFKGTYYNPNYHLATKGRTDFVIHTSKDASHPAGVLFEAKKPSNAEMITTSNLKTKAVHKIMLYYLRERIEHHNNDIKYIVITNIYER